MGVQVQSFDQTFDKMNLALKLSCIKGLPVRVVRSCKVRDPSARPPGTAGGAMVPCRVLLRAHYECTLLHVSAALRSRDCRSCCR